MAESAGTSKSQELDFTAYFSSDTQVSDPQLPEPDRKRLDELGVIGAEVLGEKGFYAAIARGTPQTARRAPAETTILVVEDDAGTVEVVQRVLSAAGYKTRAAMTRVQIIEELGRTPLADLILLDVGLGAGLSGFDILNKLRQHAVLKDVPVIMLTSMSGREHIVKGLALGADGYLTKPARPSALVDAVRAVLAG